MLITGISNRIYLRFSQFTSAVMRHYQSQMWPQIYSNDSAEETEREEKL